MSTSDAVPAIDLAHETAAPAGPYTVYAAGGMFTLHELATNVQIKQAVWQLSNGKFALILPQSKELRDLDRPDMAAYIRNADLLQVVQADVILARFDGVELDAGTVVEFMVAKSLGKPTVILRCDHHRLSSQTLDEPYNLMAKSWPRTVTVHLDTLMAYLGRWAAHREPPGDGDTFQATLQAELDTVQQGLDELALKIIEGLEAAVRMKSPYPPEYQALVYQALRYGAGGGFDQMLTQDALEDILQRLKANGTL